MTSKKQTKAEKLANEVWKQLTDNSLTRWYGTPCDAEVKIAEAITQATAELRAENERLKIEQYDLKRMYEISEQNRKNGFNILENKISELQEKRMALETERDQAQAHLASAEAKVAALVDVAEDLFEAWPAPDKYPKWFLEVAIARLNAIQKALADIQATADAYTAKVRREAIEECIEAVKSKQDDAKQNIMSPSVSSNAVMTFYRAIDAIKSLLPEPAEAEKGGA